MNMWLKQILITLCALGMVAMSTVAQGLINIRHYSVKDGLSQNTVQSVLQDKDGYIWLATWNGLEKFDGYTFKNYKTYPTDKVKLKYNRLLKLVQGGNHTLLCESYDNRIYLFDIHIMRFPGSIIVGTKKVRSSSLLVTMNSNKF